ncbi:MAG: hypothetical protein RBT34_14550 [Anaerolineaceae bacterium]|jgi:heme A synthase|nr:hypothetical protein [Anaerolineaceae bacterium]
MPLFPLSNNNRTLLRPILFSLTALEGLYVFFRLTQIPRSPGGGLAATISILLMVLAASLTLALLAAFCFTWRRSHKTLFDLSDAQHPHRLTVFSLLALAVIPLVIITGTTLHSLYAGTGNALFRLASLHLDPFLLWQAWPPSNSGAGCSSRILKNGTTCGKPTANCAGLPC